MKKRWTYIIIVAIASLVVLLIFNHNYDNKRKLVRVNSALKELGFLLSIKWPEGIPKEQCFANLLQAAPPSLRLGKVSVGKKNPLPEFLPDATYTYEILLPSNSDDKTRIVCWTRMPTNKGDLYFALYADWSYKALSGKDWERQMSPGANQ